jgi:1,4-alpha-glucan branching enzyme
VPEERAGDLAIVLHSHMPYVEGFGTYPFGEEWLFDAVCRSYVPVLADAASVTLTVTPVLADQLEAAGVAERLRRFVREFRLGSAEAEARDVPSELRPACETEAARYGDALERLEDAGDDLLALFRDPAQEGRIELVASAATHAVLPLVATTAGRRLQIDTGLRSHRRRFGPANGFWLPECAYAPGIEALLAERGMGWFCVDQSGHEAPLDALTPVATPAGPVAVPIDWEAVGWLWSPQGYPSYGAHADSFRESGRGLRLWSVEGGPYDPQLSEARACEQAAEFVTAVAARLAAFRAEHGRGGLMTFAIDTELLGHWWREGPGWLAEVIRLAPQSGVELVTASQALDRHDPQPRELHPSTWGEGKDLRTWDSPPVSDLAWAARRLELRLLSALAGGAEEPRALRAARELLAVQASDWAFLDGRREAGDYPFQRATDHARALLDALSGPQPPDPRLRNLAPDLSLAALLEP